MQKATNLMGIDIEAVVAAANGTATKEQLTAAEDARKIASSVDARIRKLAEVFRKSHA